MDPLFNRFNQSNASGARNDLPGSAGRPASSWPAGPVWAPPSADVPPTTEVPRTSQVPPAANAAAQPAEGSALTPRKRGWAKAASATVAAAVLAGGAAGYVGASLADGGTTVTRVPVATSLAYSDGALDVASLVKAVEPSVVTIQTTIEVQRGFPFGGTERGQAAGTGVILNSDGEIVTNAHVVADATSITVTLHGETQQRTATLIGSDPEHDIALIKLDDTSGLSLTPAKIGNSDAVVVGEDAVAIGNALALEGDVTVSRGIISALNRSIDVENGTLKGLIQTDAAISSGNSGGPLVNAAGEIIGINTAGAASYGNVTAENIGFAIPMNQVMSIVNQLRGQS
jgi:S1-C subfamily serine protease